MSKIPIPASLSLNFVHRRYFKRLMELKARVKRSMAANTTGTRSVAISTLQKSLIANNTALRSCLWEKTTGSSFRDSAKDRVSPTRTAFLPLSIFL